MKDLTLDEIINATAEHIWLYCITYDGLHPDISQHKNDIIDYPHAAQQAKPNTKLWIRGVKIIYSKWEEIAPNLEINLPPAHIGEHYTDETTLLNREMQYRYMVTKKGYTPYNVPKHKMIMSTDYDEANIDAHRMKGIIYIRSITIDYEPWLEIHPTDHPNPPETPVNAAGL